MKNYSKFPALLFLLIFFMLTGFGQKPDTNCNKLAKLIIDNQPGYLKFTLDDVITAKEKVPTDKYDSVVCNKLMANEEREAMINALLSRKSKNVKTKKETLQPLYFASKENELVYSHSHSVIDALSLSFSQHRPITISPDIIWLLLMQGLGIHINQNAEALRKKIVDFDGKKNLDVTVDSSFKMKSIVDWGKAIMDFKSQINNNIGEGLAKVTNTRFTTTTQNEELAYNIALMNAMSHYFTYSITLVCGIPEVRLEGTLEDWKQIESAVIELKKYDLAWWIQELAPILNEFVKARSGNVNQAFWTKIFELKPVSMGCYHIDYLNGWILKFFPYINSNGKYIRNPVLDKNIKNQEPKNSKTNFPVNIKFDNIPTGISKAQVLVVNTITSTKKICYLFSGFVGINQDSVTKYLKPEISWGVVESDKRPSKEDLENYNRPRTPPNPHF